MITREQENRKTLFSLSRVLQRWLERLIFGSGLVFNLTWEDPAVDRKALAINKEDVLLTIASAGDNMLALALDSPRQVIAVDLNPAQIYLLQLKIAAIRRLNYNDFWHLFSLEPAPRALEIYQRYLRMHLDPDAQRYWDAHIYLFRRGLVCSGVFGRTLLLLRIYLQIMCGRQALRQFFESPSLAGQAELYCNKIEPRWWNWFARAFAGLSPILLLFGAHPYQARRVQEHRFTEFLAAGIRRSLTSLPAHSNFLWQLVFLGRYLIPPDYARQENFEELKAACERIQVCIGRIESLLAELPAGSVTCFNLLDAPDWLSPGETVALWELIEQAAAPGARVLLRTIDPFYSLPAPVLAKWSDRSDPAWTSEERTGVYAHVYLYVLI